MLPSGNQALIDNRVGWARFYLTRSGLLKSEKRGTHQITEEGIKFLKTNPAELKTKDLEHFKQFVEFKDSISKKNDNETDENLKNEDEQNVETAVNERISLQ